MILRKPYAFLIKHFRIIHLLLLIPIGYLISKTTLIVNFFRNFVSNNYTTNIVNISGTYINLFMYLSVLIILITVLAVYYLMKKKEKSTKLYFFALVYYIIIFVLIGVSHGILSGMERDVITAQSARAYRDISSVIVLPQYFLFIYVLLRGIGFDIKKFNFANDLKDLDIDASSSEEFEVSVDVSGYKYLRTLRRFIREFKYYYKENKFVFTCLISVGVIFIGTVLYLNFGVYNKTYHRKDKMTHNYFNIKIENSYLTNLSQNGNVIMDGKYYLALQLKIDNKTKNSYTLDYNNFRLIVDGKSIFPTLDRGEYFVDIGKPYHKEKLKKESSNTYVLVYELNNNQVKSRYKVKILEDISYGVGAVNSRYRNIELTPIKIDDINVLNTYKLEKTVNLKDTSLGYTTFKVNNYSFSNNYVYDYELCNNNGCNTVKDIVGLDVGGIINKTTLLVLNMEYNLDKTTVYGSNVKADNLFFNNFLSLEYTKDGITKETSLSNRTTDKMKDTLVFETNSEVKDADNINLLVTIRNNRYKINLK